MSFSKQSTTLRARMQISIFTSRLLGEWNEGYDRLASAALRQLIVFLLLIFEIMH